MVRVPTLKLNNGFDIPAIGLGTFSAKGDDAVKAVKHGIDKGYRYIDTAPSYENEVEVGIAIREKIAEGVVKREDIFLTTKLWCIHHEPSRVEHGCKVSLERLGVDYIDLYLMHFPVGFKYVDDVTYNPKPPGSKLVITNDVDYVDTWKAMEKLVKKGLVRSIGLSNFNAEQTERILKICEIRPVANQVECNIELNQQKLLDFSVKRGIILIDYCPIARPKPAEKTPASLYNDLTQSIADKYKKTPVQVALRYLIQRGTVPVPGAGGSTMAMLDENFDVFDFELTPDEIKILDGFNTGNRLCPFEFVDPKHKYYPFNNEF